MRTIPSQQEIYVLACILQFGGEVDGYGESRIAVTCTMADIPMWGYRCLAVADETHGVHQTHVLTDGICEHGVVLLSRKVGEIHAAARHVAKHLILATAIAPTERQAPTKKVNIFFIKYLECFESRSGLYQDLFK